jgi:hypothetical protein
MKSGSQHFRANVVSAVLFLFSVFLLTAETGCNGVRRRLTVRTDPPGATVWINDQEIGRTPISHNVVYSGTYKIRLAMEGKKTKTVMYTLKTPWYLWPGVDFISENLVPGEIRDQQICNERMEPDLVAAPEELFENAAQMRQEAHAQSDLARYQHSPRQTSHSSNTEHLSESGWVKQD